MTEEKMRSLLEEARERLDWDSQAEDLCARIDAALGEVIRSRTAAPFDQATQTPAASTVERVARVLSEELAQQRIDAPDFWALAIVACRALSQEGLVAGADGKGGKS